MTRPYSCCLFFFNDTATTEIYTLSLHDALPISAHIKRHGGVRGRRGAREGDRGHDPAVADDLQVIHRDARPQAHPRGKAGASGQPDLVADVVAGRSEEHTSELQSLAYLVCRLLLEKK